MLNGRIDNRSSVAYQRMHSDSMFPTPNDYIPQIFLLNWANQPFMSPGALLGLGLCL